MTMDSELQDLKDLWHRHNDRLEKQVKLNSYLLQKMELGNTRSALRKATAGPFSASSLALCC